MTIVPQTLPRMSWADLRPRVEAAGLDVAANPFIIAGVRGYYRQSMGPTGGNDRGIYDDALFIVSPAVFAAFNANTDPSIRRPGQGTGAGKGIATLQPGLWQVHRFDNHRTSKSNYPAICQRAGPVTVLRDGTNGTYLDSGMFGINIHRGSWNGTSSEGCQTIYPSQWDSFMATARDQARRFHGSNWQSRVIPYVLLEEV